MSSPNNDWIRLYQRSLSEESQTKPASTDATIATTKTSTSSGLIPDGRVSKPIRKRSRASRRTPTTLLNTNTANFRAMVQQYTRGPAALGGHWIPSSSSFNLGTGSSQQMMNTNMAMIPRGGVNFVELQQFEEQQQYMMVSSAVNNSASHGGQLGFVESSRGGAMWVVPDRLEGGSVWSSVRSSSINNPINRDTYIL